MFKLISFRGDGAFWPLAERSDLDTVSRPRSLAGSLLAAPWRVMAGLAKELAARRAMHALADLDDRMLRDIGLDRGQIPNAPRQRRIQRMHGLRATIPRWPYTRPIPSA